MEPVVVRRIHHVGIVVRRLDEAYGFYRDTLGLPLMKEAEVSDQGVRAALLAAGDSEVELLEPLDAASGVGRYLARRGEGLHHVCFDIADVDAALDVLKATGVAVLDQAARAGLAGRVAFLHPKACAGVLVELATPSDAATAGDAAAPSDDASRGGGAAEAKSVAVRLKRLVIGAREPKQTVSVFQSLFGLQEVALNSGPRVMVGVGRGALLVVPAEEVGGTEGMVALSLVADDFTRLTAAFDRRGTRCIRGTGEVTVQPESSHGVHLHISRFD